MAAASPPHQPVKRARAADFGLSKYFPVCNYVLIQLVAVDAEAWHCWIQLVEEFDIFAGTKDATGFFQEKKLALNGRPLTFHCAFFWGEVDHLFLV